MQNEHRFSASQASGLGQAMRPWGTAKLLKKRRPSQGGCHSAAGLRQGAACWTGRSQDYAWRERAGESARQGSGSRQW
jgi:hypothetical protein